MRYEIDKKNTLKLKITAQDFNDVQIAAGVSHRLTEFIRTGIYLDFGINSGAIIRLQY